MTAQRWVYSNANILALSMLLTVAGRRSRARMAYCHLLNNVQVRGGDSEKRSVAARKTKMVFTTKCFMILRSPKEDENGGSLCPFSPQRVIPAQAGIQVRSPFQLAWIPAFAGMTE